ncbi:MAG: hypothetical protein ABI678_07575 [Kofleriaceae bacterium]
MHNISKADLANVLGGAGSPLNCTVDNPQGKAPQQFMESARPSSGASEGGIAPTLTTRGMGMLNDGRPSMPSE